MKFYHVRQLLLWSAIRCHFLVDLIDTPVIYFQTVVFLPPRTRRNHLTHIQHLFSNVDVHGGPPVWFEVETEQSAQASSLISGSYGSTRNYSEFSDLNVVCCDEEVALEVFCDIFMTVHITQNKAPTRYVYWRCSSRREG